MALNDTAADAALDTWIAGMDPAPADPVALKAAMAPLIRAIYAGIVANAVINPGTMAAGGDAVTGTGTVT